jgi:peroxiredoxin
MKRIIFILCFISFGAFSQDRNVQELFTTTIKTLDGKDFPMTEIRDNKASVFVFLLADCPACENYALTLNQMNEKYKGSGIGFYGVFPGTYSKLEEMLNYNSTYKINFPLLVDKDKKLVKVLKAKTAPQAFLISKNGQVLYNGRIDDWMYAVGKKRTVITHHELQDAIDATIKGNKIPVASTVAVGCLIE